MTNQSVMLYSGVHGSVDYAEPEGAIDAHGASDTDHWDEPAAGSYALVHAGRQWQFGPIAFWIVIGILVVMAGLTLITAPHFPLPDAVPTPVPRGPRQMQLRFPDRVP